MMRLAAAYNNAPEDYGHDIRGQPERQPDAERRYATRGKHAAERRRRIDDGGVSHRAAPAAARATCSSTRNGTSIVNGAYQLPWDMEVAGNLFGKQGTPYPYFINRPSVARERRESWSRRSSTRSGSITCGTSICGGRRTHASAGRGNVQFIADLFNVFNSNTEITRERNAEGAELPCARLEPQPAHPALRRACRVVEQGSTCGRVPLFAKGPRQLGPFSFAGCVI